MHISIQGPHICRVVAVIYLEVMRLRLEGDSCRALHEGRSRHLDAMLRREGILLPKQLLLIVVARANSGVRLRVLMLQ